MKSLNSNWVSKIDFYTVCFTPRSFGALARPERPWARFFPPALSLRLCQAVQKRTQNHPERATIRKPGEKSALRDFS